MLNLLPIYKSANTVSFEPCQMGRGDIGVANGTIQAASPQSKAYSENMKMSRKNGRGLASSLADRTIRNAKGQQISGANLGKAVAVAARGIGAGRASDGAIQTLQQGNEALNQKASAARGRSAQKKGRQLLSAGAPAKKKGGRKKKVAA